MNFLKREPSNMTVRSALFGKISDSKNGFINVYFTFFLSLLMMFMFSFGFVFYASQSKEAFRKTCVTQAVDIQKRLIKAEKQLFALNSVSTLLRAHLTALYAILPVSVPPTTAATLAAIEEVKLLQTDLELAQNAIIKAAETDIAMRYGKMFFQANKENFEFMKSWSNFLYILTATVPVHYPQLAVRPDSWGGTAPNYELENDFETKQRVELKWHNFFSINQHVQKILNPKGFFGEPAILNYELVCKIQPERRETTWDLNISLGKH